MTTRRTFLQSLTALCGLPFLARYAKGEDMKVTLPPLKKKVVRSPRPVVIKDDEITTVPMGPQPVNYEALLWAIAEKETFNRDHIIGPSGERSKYGLMREVWRQHKYAASIFADECKGWTAMGCALGHLHWLDRNLPRKTITEVYNRPYVLAWCWHGGLSSWPHGSKKKSTKHLHEYATHVVNLMNDRLNRRPL